MRTDAGRPPPRQTTRAARREKRCSVQHAWPGSATRWEDNHTTREERRLARAKRNAPPRKGRGGSAISRLLPLDLATHPVLGGRLPVLRVADEAEHDLLARRKVGGKVGALLR